MVIMADGAVARSQFQDLEAELMLWKRIAYRLAEKIDPYEPDDAVSKAYEDVRRGQR